MKKLNYIFLLLFVVVVASCGDDDDGATPATPVTPTEPDEPVAEQPDKPVLSVEDPQTDFQGVFKSEENGSIEVSLTGTLDARFLKLEIFKSLDGEESLYEEIEESDATFKANGDLVYEFNYDFEAEDGNKGVSFSAILTDSLEQQSEKVVLAEGEVLLPMIMHEVQIASDFPVSGSSQIPYYLRLTKTMAEGQRVGTLVEEGDHEEIAMIFSANDGSGYYLSSPNAIIESDLVVKVEPKTKTKFKSITVPELGFGVYDEYDSFVIRKLFEDASFNSNPERAEKILEGNAFAFETDNEEIGLFYIDKVESVGGTPETGPKRNQLSLKIWLMQ